jgi:hypothetical protein
VIQSRKIKWSWHVACIGEKPKGKRPLGRPIGGWDDNIKMVVKLFGSTWAGFMTQNRDR